MRNRRIAPSNGTIELGRGTRPRRAGRDGTFRNCDCWKVLVQRTTGKPGKT